MRAFVLWFGLGFLWVAASLARSATPPAHGLDDLVVGGAPRAIGAMPRAGSGPHAALSSAEYVNGPLVTQTGVGFGGADVSVADTTFGFGVQSGAARIADDFTVPSGPSWRPRRLKFFAYQTFSSTVSPFTSATVQVWQGAPPGAGGVVLGGDTTTNRLISSSFANVYRVVATHLTNADRPIMELVLDLSWLPALSPGTYWIDVGLVGAASLSGPFAPPVAPSPSMGNARRFDVAANAWSQLFDATTGVGVELPFRLEYAPDVGDVPLAFECFLKSESNGAQGQYGESTAVWGDTLAIGAPGSVGGVRNGEVYVYRRSAGAWELEAVVSAPNGDAGDRFGHALALQGDTLVVGAPYEDGPTNTDTDSGAVYVFVRSGGSWSPQAYLKPTLATPFFPCSIADLRFGFSLALCGDTLAVGCERGPGMVCPSSLQPPNVQIFERLGGAWSAAARLEFDTPGFGFSLSLSEDRIAVGIPAFNGSVWTYRRPAGPGTPWSHESSIYASDFDFLDLFGWSVSLRGDRLVVGAPGEDSGATGVGGNPLDNSRGDSGAVYVFERSAAGAWVQEAFIKASNTDTLQRFGWCVVAENDHIAVGAIGEESAATGINGAQAGAGLVRAGAAYRFELSSTGWRQTHYIKALNTGAGDQFGSALAMSDSVLVVGAPFEDSNGSGVNPDPWNDLSSDSGAAYVFETQRPARLEVLLCEVPMSGKAVVPGARDPWTGHLAFTFFRSIGDIVLSPDGRRWLVRATTQQGSDAENILLLGSGALAVALAQEGLPVPGGLAGEVVDFFGSGLGRFNSLGQLAYSLRARGGSPSTFQKVLLSSGAAQSIVTQMGDPYSGLIDIPSNVSGDETVGNSIGSIHLLNDGRIGAHDVTIGNISSTRRPALFYDRAAFHQTNVTSVVDLAGTGSVTWTAMAGNSFHTTPDGQHWIARGERSGGVEILVRDGRVVIEEGQVFGAFTPVVGAIQHASLAASGDWFARGRDNSGTSSAAPDWAARNGVVVAQTGYSLGADELGDTFHGFTGNSVGDWVLTARTDRLDPTRDDVLVWNGKILAREGDPVDLDGNGLFDDDAFLGRGDPALAAFMSDRLALSDENLLYFIGYLRNGAGQDLGSIPASGWGDALFRILIPGCGAASAYCTAGTSSNGCVGSIRGAGEPSPSEPSGFTITVSGVDGQRQGLIFYGVNGPTMSSWGGGSSVLCVKSPTQRTGAQSSGGTASQCDGELSLDWNQWLANSSGALGAPFVGGQTVWAQAWWRDPPSPKSTTLSDALEFRVCP